MQTVDAPIERHPVLQAEAEELELSQQVRAYLQPRFWASWAAVLFTWIGILSTFEMCVIVNKPLLVVPVAILIMGAFQHRFFTIYHEAFHGSLFESRELNSFVGKWFAAYPALVAYENARKRHLTHHKLTETDEDPERTSHLRSVRALIPFYFPWPWMVGGVLAKFGILKNPVTLPLTPGRGEWNSAEHTESKEVALVLTTQAVMFCTFVCLFHWYGFLFHVSLVFANPLLAIVRQWVEHYNGDQRPAKDSRYVVITPNLIERFLFAPMNFNLHAAHHFYPRVPFSNLPQVQRLIDKKYPDLIRRKGYLAVILKELPW